MIPSFSKCFRLVMIFVFLTSFTAYAQPPLPDLQAVSSMGVNVISWLSTFDGIKSIAVQRSNDSVYNYSTIGYVKDLKKGVQAFIDGHPNPGVNWYRLYIVFSSDLTWFSNRAKLVVDSADIMSKRVLPPNDSLQKMVTTMVLGEPGDPGELNAYTYIRSQYVFTNPFTGHVNVELPDTADRKNVYSLTFFDQKDNQVLEVPKVAEQSIIIDKRNFQRKGIYKFELRKDNVTLIEKGYITIY